MTAIIQIFLPSSLLYFADSMFIYNSASNVSLEPESPRFQTAMCLPTVKPLAATSTLALRGEDLDIELLEMV